MDKAVAKVFIGLKCGTLMQNSIPVMKSYVYVYQGLYNGSEKCLDQSDFRPENIYILSHIIFWSFGHNIVQVEEWSFIKPHTNQLQPFWMSLIEVLLFIFHALFAILPKVLISFTEKPHCNVPAVQPLGLLSYLSLIRPILTPSVPSFNTIWRNHWRWMKEPRT